MADYIWALYIVDTMSTTVHVNKEGMSAEK